MDQGYGNTYSTSFTLDWGTSFTFDISAEDTFGQPNSREGFADEIPNDNSGPSISNMDVSYDGTTVEVTADISDDVSGVDKDTVEVVYDSGWFNFLGTTVEMNHVSGDTYEGEFELAYGEKFQYKVTASDNAGNPSTAGPRDEQVARGTAEFQVTNNDDEAKTVDVLVDGSQHDTIEVAGGETKEVDLTVNPVTHRFSIRYDEVDLGETFTSEETEVVPQSGTETIGFEIPERTASEIALSCAGNCSFGTYNPNNGRPRLMLNVKNYGDAPLDWRVTSSSVEVVETGSDYLVVKPVPGEVGSFDRSVTVMNTADRYEGDTFASVTLTGTATIEPEPPSVDITSHPTKMRVGVETPRFSAFVEPGAGGTDDQPKPSTAMDHIVTWYVNGVQVAQSNPDDNQGIGALDRAALVADEAGEQTVKVVVRDPNTEKTASDSVTVDAVDVNGELVEYRSPVAGTEYELDKWYTVEVEVKNTGGLTHTFEVEAGNPSGTEIKDKDATKQITLDPGESGSVAFQQKFYGVYTPTRGFTHRLYIDSGTDQQRQQIDESSITLKRPPAGDLTVQFDDSQGNDVNAKFELRNANGEVIEEGRGDSILRNLPAGEYTLVASALGHVEREKTFTLSAGTSRTVSLSLPPEETAAKIVDGSFQVVSGAGPYAAGDKVTAEVQVRNTGNRAFEFFVGLSARDDRGVTYDNGGQTGQFVSLEPGAEETVTLEWVVTSQTPNGSYDLLSAVWYDYPEQGELLLDSAAPLNEAVEVSLTDAPGVPTAFKQVISRYQDSADQKVGVLRERIIDGERYRAAVYFGPNKDVGISGIESAPAATTVLKSQERWSSLNTEQVLAFRVTGDGYELVTNPAIARRVYQMYTPGGFEVSDPQSAGVEAFADDEFNNVLNPSQSEVEDVNNLLENEVFIQQQITQSWVKTEYDQYLVVSRAMASTGTKSIIPDAMHQRLTDAESVAGAVSVANAALQETDRSRVRKVLELYVDNVNRLDSISKYGSQATVVLGWVLRFSQYQVYADQRIAMMQAALDRASSDSDVSIDPQLRSAMQTVINEHESLEQKTFNRFKEFLVEKGRAQVINIAKQGSKVFTKKFGSYVVSLAGKQISKKTASGVASVASGVAGQVMAGLTISNFLYNMDGMYEAGLKAKWAHVAAEQLDAVADDYRQEHLGAATYDAWNTYRKLNGIHYHTMSVYYEGRSGVLNATWVDNAKDAIYTTFGLSNGWTIEDARQRYIENAAELDSIVREEYRPDTLDLATQSIPDSGSGPVLDVESMVDFGTVTGSETATVTVRNRGDAPLRIESVVTPDGITASAATQELGAGEETELSIRVDESVAPGPLSETVFMHSNDASSPTRVQVSGTVEVATGNLTGTVVAANLGDAISGASIYLDGDQVATTDPTGGFSVTVEPGTYTLRVAQSSYQSVERTVTVSADETKTQSVSLEPKPATLAVSANVSNATVLVDDRRVGTTPVSVERPPGEYEVVVSASGYETVTETVLLSVDDASLSVDLAPAGSENQPPVASVNTNQSAVQAGTAVLLDASGSTDPDGNNSALSYGWTLVESPEDVDVPSFQSAEQNAVTFSAPGTYTFEVTVTDAAGDSDTDTVTVPVEPTDAERPPDVSEFRLSNSSGYTLKIQFDSPDSVTDITVPITAGGDTVATLTEANFTENDGTYTARFNPGSSGTFTATLKRAANEYGNGASGQEARANASGPTEYTVGITSPTQSSPATLDANTGSELQITTEVTIKERMPDSEFQQLVAALTDSSPPVSVSVGGESAPIMDLTFSPPSDVEAGTTVPMTLLVEAPSLPADAYDLTVETDAIKGVTIPGASATSRDAVMYETDSTPPSVTATATGDQEVTFNVTNEASEPRTLELVVNAGNPVTVAAHSSNDGTWRPDQTGWKFVEVPPGETVTGTVNLMFDDTFSGSVSVIGQVQAGGAAVASDSATLTKALNQSPVVEANGPYEVKAGGTVELRSAGTSDADGTVTSKSWAVTNGPGTVQNDTYVAPGTVTGKVTATVTLEATDDNGTTTTDTATVTVTPPAPEVSGLSVSNPSEYRVRVSFDATQQLSAIEVPITRGPVTLATLTESDFTYRNGEYVGTASTGLPGQFTATLATASNDYGDAASGQSAAVTVKPIDRTPPQLGATVTRVDASMARVNLTTTEPINRSTLEVRVTLPTNVTRQVSMTAMGDRYTGTFDLAEKNGVYSIEASAADEAANEGMDTAMVNLRNVSTTNKQVVVKSGQSGAFVRFNTTAEVSDTFVTLTSSDAPLDPLSADFVGAAFLNGQLGERLSANLDKAIIGIPVTSDELPAGTTPENVTISRFDPETGTWTDIDTDIREVTLSDGASGTYWVATVQHFSTYGAVAQDETPPTVSKAAPQGKLSYGETDPTVRFQYDDTASSVNASEVEVFFDGEPVTEMDRTLVGSRAVRYQANDLEVGETYNATVRAVDKAGNAKNVSTTFTIPVDTSPPKILSATPTNNTTLAVNTSAVQLAVTYLDDETGVAPENVDVLFDGEPVTESARVNNTHVVYTAQGLSNGSSHTFSVRVPDNATNANVVTETVKFSVTAANTSDGGNSSDEAGSGGGGGGGGMVGSEMKIDHADRDDHHLVTLTSPESFTMIPLEISDGARRDGLGVQQLGLQSIYEPEEMKMYLYEPADSPEGNVRSLTKGTAVSYFRIELRRTDPKYMHTARIRFSVPDSALPDGAAMSQVTLYNHRDGEWQPLKTTPRSETTYQAQTDTLGQFAIGITTANETTSATTTQLATKTASAPATSTQPASETTTETPAQDNDTGTSIPGFGIGTALVALCAAATLLVRRES